jgi:putative FmdB family regulatory protein
MPLYQYHCDRCDLDAEVLQKVGEPAPLHCDAEMRKMPAGSSFAFVTKGGNLFNFSGAAPGRRHRSKKLATIGHNHGLGSNKRREAWKQAPIERLPPKLVKP